MTFEDRLVDIAGMCQTHDHIPLHLLGKHLKGARHIFKLTQYQGVMTVGHPEEQSFVITLQSEHLQITGRGHQRTVIVVHRIAQHIVVAV